MQRRAAVAPATATTLPAPAPNRGCPAPKADAAPALASPGGEEEDYIQKIMKKVNNTAQILVNPEERA